MNFVYRVVTGEKKNPIQLKSCPMIHFSSHAKRVANVTLLKVSVKVVGYISDTVYIKTQ